MRDFWSCFVPLFVAVDAIGALALFIGLIADLPRAAVRRLIVQSMVTALIVALAFLFAGQPLLRRLGITEADFMVAGGILLLVLSISDMLALGKPQTQVDPESLGAVPLGVPLIVGPAVLATLILLADRHTPGPTVLALLANILFAGVLFWFSAPVHRALGKSGAKTISKVANLLLAAYAVMMMREGVLQVVRDAARTVAGKP